jgi:cytochrome c oxidase subunit 1
VLSSAGASILGIGYLLPLCYFAWSIKYGAPAGDNPWNAAGLEWTTSSPPPTHNFEKTPTVTHEPYNYEDLPKNIEIAREATVVGR